MQGKMSRCMLRIVAILVSISAAALTSIAQGDPDPNSPQPVLLSQRDSTRALAVPASESKHVEMSRIAPRAFVPDSRITLFVTNLLRTNEGPNAFRMYGQDRNAHVYRFPVIDIRPLSRGSSIYAVTVQLTDEIGYWQPPPA